MNAVLDIHKLVPAWQTLISVAPVSPIESEANYEQATALLNGLFDVVRDDANHSFYYLVSVVVDLVEAYEINYGPF